MGLRVELLGSVRVMGDGAEIQIGRSQVRRAVALLACREAAVSPDELVEHLWADRLPSDPRASLRVALSRVRDALQRDHEQLVASPAGYLLDVETDVRDFEGLVDESARSEDVQQRADMLAAALDLWRSDVPAADIGEAPLLEASFSRLLRLRANATVDYVDALFELGQHEAVVGFAQPIVAGDPSDERLAMICARSLAAAGRKGAAMETLAQTRAYLRDELGFDPSAAFAETEAQILSDGVQIGRRSAPLAPAPTVHRFVGREHELGVLEAAEHGLYVIVGEPGSGKSALLRQLVHRFGVDDRLVLRADAIPTPTRPMETLAALLVDVARMLPERDHPESLVASLMRLAPEVVDAAKGVAPVSREGLLLNAREAIEDFAAATDAIIVVEDAQWLDRASAQVLNELFIGGRVTIIATTRESVPIHARFLHDLTADCHHLVQLGALTVEDIAAYVSAELPALPQTETVLRLAQQSGGNALFVTMLSELLAEGALGQAKLPTSILVTIQKRIDSLSARAQQTLQVASVFTGSFSLDLLRELQPQADGDISEAVADGLIEKTGVAETYKFTHALVADAAYQLLADGVRLELHDDIGRLLEDSGASVAEFAVHCGAAASMYPLRAVRSHLAATRGFAAAFDWDTAYFHAERGLAHLDEQGVEDPTAQAELFVLAGAALRSQGKQTGDELLLRGLELSSAHDSLDIWVDAVVALCSHGRMGSPQGAPILLALESALDHDSLTMAQRALLLAAGSTLVSVSPLQQRGRDMFRQAFEIVQEIDDASVARAVLLRTHLGTPHFDDLGMRRQATDQLAELAGNDPDQAWEVAFLRFHLAMIHRDSDQAFEWLQRMEEFTPRTRLRRRDFGMRFSHAAWARFNGEFEAAEAILDEAISIGAESFEDEWTFVTWAAIMTSIRESQGRLHELLPMFDERMAEDPTWPIWHVLAAAGAATAGDGDRVREELDWLMRDDFACLSPDVSWSATLSFLSRPVELAQDARAASLLLEIIEPFAGLNLWNGTCVHQPVDDVIEIYRSVVAQAAN